MIKISSFSYVFVKFEAYLSNVPVINIDKIIGIDEYNKNYSKLTLEWHQLANIPKNKKEFINLINNKHLSVKNKAIDKQLKNANNAHVKVSIYGGCKRINDQIGFLAEFYVYQNLPIKFHDELNFKNSVN